MDFSCLTISNIFIYLFTQNPNSLTGFRIPRFLKASNEKKNFKMKVSGSNVPNFLDSMTFINKKTKIRIVLIPKNEKSEMDCPIEIARLTIHSCQKSSESLIMDDFSDIEIYDDENSEQEGIMESNQILKSIVNASILSPFVGIMMSFSGKKEKIIQKNFKIEFRVEQNLINQKKQQKMSSANKKEEIIIINPESEKFEDELKNSFLNFSKKNKNSENKQMMDKKNSLDSEKWSKKSKESSNSISESEKIFFGKTYSMNWKINLDKHLSLINLHIHDNLNSICSYISKVNFDQKSEQSRKRFFSEEYNRGLRKKKLLTPRNKKNYSSVSKYLPINMNESFLPFRTIKDDYIKTKLIHSLYDNSAHEKYEIFLKEPKNHYSNQSNDTFVEIIRSEEKKTDNQLSEFYLFEKKHGLKGLFKISQILKNSIKNEIYSKRKEKKNYGIRSFNKISSYSSSKKNFQQDSFNFFKNKKKSSNDISLSNNNFTSQTTNDANKTIEEDIDENITEKFSDNRKQSDFKVLIKFGKN